MKRTSEAAFETVIEAHLLENGYMPVARVGGRFIGPSSKRCCL